MALYTLTHSCIACVMYVTGDARPEPVELMYMKPGDICAMLPGKLGHMPAVWEALPPLVRHEAAQRFAVIFAVEVSKRGPVVDAFRNVPLSIEV